MVYTIYYLYYQSKHLSRYPEPVAKHLRRAMYYTDVKPYPRRALLAFQDAVRVADDINMNPFSPEILGLKMHIAEFHQKYGYSQNAINIFEIVRGDCLKWIELYGDKPENAEMRTRLLRTSVQLSMQLVDCYSDPTIAQHELAEEKITWVLTTLYKEQKRRADAGLKHDEAAGWFSEDENGALLESRNIHPVLNTFRHPNPSQIITRRHSLM